MKRVVVVAGALALMGAAPAHGAKVALHGGSSTLALKTKLGVVAAPVKPAARGKRGIELPISRGRVDPDTLSGTLRHRGGVQLRAGKRSLRLTGLRKSGTRLSAAVGKRRVTFRLKAGTVKRVGFATDARGIKLIATRGAARALNRGLRTRVRSGAAIGTLAVRTEPAEFTLASGTTTLVLDSGFIAALNAQGVNYFASQEVTVPTPGTLEFPITGGRLDFETFAGTIRHDGTLGLFRDYRTLELEGLLLDTVSGGLEVTLFQLAKAEAERGEIEGRDVTLGAVPLTLTQDAADALNTGFPGTAFAAGAPLGTLSVAAVGD